MMVVIIERADMSVFIELNQDGSIKFCLDEDGNKTELSSLEKDYVQRKYKSGECDAEYDWGYDASKAD
jgi:hypothetical protein